MTRFTPPASFRTIVLIGALATTTAGMAIAQDDGVPTEKMRAAIVEALALTPNADDGSGVTVVIEDGRYVLQGFVQGRENYQYAQDALAAVEGLDLSLIEDRIVRN